MLTAVRRWCVVGVAVAASLALSACSSGTAIPLTVAGQPAFGSIGGTSCSLAGTIVTATGTFRVHDPAIPSVTLGVYDTRFQLLVSKVVNGGRTWQAGATWDWTVSATVGSATPASCHVTPGGLPVGASGGS